MNEISTFRPCCAGMANDSALNDEVCDGKQKPTTPEHKAAVLRMLEYVARGRCAHCGAQRLFGGVPAEPMEP